MNRPRAQKSEAEPDEGTAEPEGVYPIADDKQDPDTVGIMYEGEDYGEDSWIMCNTEDLQRIIR